MVVGRVLIMCEMSGRVRDAFLSLGHDAYSVDMLPTESPIPGRHFQCDALFFLAQHEMRRFDLMIAHPPCRYLANSGAKHLYIGGRKENGQDPERWERMREAAGFFNALLSTDIPRICIENPIQHSHARELIRQYDQGGVQPYHHGHAETKQTCFWLKNLPPLKPTAIMTPDYEKYPAGRGNGFKPVCHYESPGADRSIRRSRTYPGLARALAEQYGALL